LDSANIEIDVSENMERRNVKMISVKQRNVLFRHPKKCMFFAIYKHCKFGTIRRVDHDIIGQVKDTKEIEKMKKNLEELKKAIMEKDKEIDRLNNNLQKRVNDLEKSNGALKKHLEEIKAENKELKTLINSRIDCDKIEEFQSKEMENNVESEIEEISMTDENKCGKCDLIGKNETGLKVHVSTKKAFNADVLKS
jgi:septal ring factor EnvC (AmiA/AmiB activator)